MSRELSPVLLIAACLAAPVGAVPGPDPELTAYLEQTRARIADPARAAGDRLRLALEAAATIDRAARLQAEPAARRRLWEQAIAWLDAFARERAAPEQGPVVTARIAAIRQAQARSWRDQAELSPSDPAPRAEAALLLEAIIEALRPLARPEAAVPPDQRPEIRYRLARALFERAALHPPEHPSAPALLEEARRLAESVPADDALRGEALLLDAEIQRAAGRPAAGLEALQAAREARSPVAPAQALPVQVGLLLDLGRFEEAERVRDESDADPAARARLEIEIALARRAAHAEGGERDRWEAAAFDAAELLPGDARRLALLRLARGLDEPAPGLPARAWGLLAEGKLLLGDHDRAAALFERGAGVAAGADDPATASDLRFRAATVRYQRREFDRARPLLRAVRDDPAAGALRPRAAMLLALAAAEAGSPRDPEEAMQDVVRRFPDDPLADEARLRLGRLQAGRGDLAGAQAQWDAIPRGRPAWTPGRLALIAALLDRLESADGPTPEERREMIAALDGVREALPADHELDVADRVALGVALARFELSDRVGRLREADARLARLAALPLRAEQRAELKGWQAVLWLRGGRYAEAERLLPEALDGARRPALWELGRALGRLAVAGETDLIRRRIGSALGGVVDRLRMGAGPGPAEGDTLDLLDARAGIARGDAASAGPVLRALDGRRGRLDDATLWGVSETWWELEEFDRALAACAERIGRLRAGGTAWFETKHRIARILAAAGRRRDAVALIDATALLHPGLGGPPFRDRFDRLRRQLDGAGLPAPAGR